jgi:hypothetical protein
MEIQQTALLHEEFKKDVVEERTQVQIEGYKVKVSKAEKLGEAAIYSSCPVCNVIFEGENEVVVCGNPSCATIYHVKCFEAVKNRQCKICGKILLLK